MKNKRTIIIVSVIIAAVLIIGVFATVKMNKKTALTEGTNEDTTQITDAETSTGDNLITEAESETTSASEQSTEAKTEQQTTQAVTATEPITEPVTTTAPQVITIFNCGTISGGYTATKYETAILEAINAERKNHGLSAVSYNGNIHTLARIRVDEQFTVKGHERPNGNRASSVFKERGINFTNFGEIIGINIPESDEGVDLVIKMWMESEGHRNAILNGAYTYAAVAASSDGEGYSHVVCLFYNYS